LPAPEFVRAHYGLIRHIRQEGRAAGAEKQKEKEDRRGGVGTKKNIGFFGVVMWREWIKKEGCGECVYW
jgi:hypothetical protein